MRQTRCAHAVSCTKRRYSFSIPILLRVVGVIEITLRNTQRAHACSMYRVVYLVVMNHDTYSHCCMCKLYHRYLVRVVDKIATAFTFHVPTFLTYDGVHPMM